MKKYLLVTDLDGTLLNSDHEISEYSYNKIKQFQEKEGLFTFATGRMNKSVNQFIQALNITVPVITYNGAQVLCPIENKIIYEKNFVLTDEMYEELLQITYGEVLFYFNNEVFTIRKGQLIKKFEAKEKIFCKIMESDEKPEEVTKIMILSNEREKLEALAVTFEERFETISFVFSETNYLELLPKFASKGEALNVIKKLYELSDVYTVGFGNNLNDVSLLQSVNRGIAVKNSVPGLLEVADHISAYSNNEDAVGQYIDSLLTKSE